MTWLASGSGLKSRGKKTSPIFSWNCLVKNAQLEFKIFVVVKQNLPGKGIQPSPAQAHWRLGNSPDLPVWCSFKVTVLNLPKAVTL